MLTKLLTNGLDLDSSGGTWTDVAYAQVPGNWTLAGTDAVTPTRTDHPDFIGLNLAPLTTFPAG